MFVHILFLSDSYIIYVLPLSDFVYFFLSSSVALSKLSNSFYDTCFQLHTSTLSSASSPTTKYLFQVLYLLHVLFVFHSNFKCYCHSFIMILALIANSCQQLECIYIWWLPIDEALNGSVQLRRSNPLKELLLLLLDWLLLLSWLLLFICSATPMTGWLPSGFPRSMVCTPWASWFIVGRFSSCLGLRRLSTLMLSPFHVLPRVADPPPAASLFIFSILAATVVVTVAFVGRSGVGVNTDDMGLITGA